MASITAITKTQVEGLLKRCVVQMSLFDETLAEVLDGDMRYVLRRNPERAAEIAAGRRSKLARLQKLAQAKNAYLAAIPARVWLWHSAKSKPGKRSCGSRTWS